VNVTITPTFFGPTLTRLLARSTTQRGLPCPTHGAKLADVEIVGTDNPLVPEGHSKVRQFANNFAPALAGLSRLRISVIAPMLVKGPAHVLETLSAGIAAAFVIMPHVASDGHNRAAIFSAVSI
jgi:hypothetical protein